MGKPLRVLVLEDSEDDFNKILSALKQGNYDPIYQRVDSAGDMLKAFTSQPWDVILSDYQLHKFNALGVLTLLKQRNLNIPLIIVSESLGEETVAMAMKSGVNDYILKNKLDRLVPAITRELREANVRQERRSVMNTLRDRAQQQATIAELSQKALQETDIQSLMGTCCEVVAKTLNVEYSKIMELILDGQGLLMKAGYGWKEGNVGRLTMGTGKRSQAGYTLFSGEPVLVENIKVETRFSLVPLYSDHKILSGISVVIPGHGKPMGVLSAHSTKMRKFNWEDVDFLRSVANIFSFAMKRVHIESDLRMVNDELKKSRAILREMAIHDELTLLYNRREIFRILTDEIVRCKRYNRFLGLAMADLDHFKRVNDTYGHLVGDEVLRQIAMILRKNTRSVDKVARYGGEEFIILFPERNRKDNLETAERLCKFISQRPIVITMEEQEPFIIPVRVSIGVANFPDDADSIDSLIQAADQALYESKKRGRNCVVQYCDLQSKETTKQN